MYSRHTPSPFILSSSSIMSIAFKTVILALAIALNFNLRLIEANSFHHHLLAPTHPRQPTQQNTIHETTSQSLSTPITSITHMPSVASFPSFTDSYTPIDSYSTPSLSTSSSLPHSPRSLYSWTFPSFGKGEWLLDQDNSTVVTEGIVRPTIPSGEQRWEFTFDAQNEFMIFYANVSADDVFMTIQFAGTSTLPAGPKYLAQNVDFSYLAPEDRLSYQQFSLSPRSAQSICRTASSSSRISPCPVVLILMARRSSEVPFRLSVMKNRMATWSNLISGNIPTNRVMTWGIEISAGDFPVLFQMQPEQSNPQLVDAMIYLFNSANPIQWFAPTANTFSTPHQFGSDVGFLFTDSAGSGGRTVIKSGVPPDEGGNKYADPNFQSADRFQPNLYLVAVYVARQSPDPRPSKPLNFVQLLLTPNFTGSVSTQWNGSTYGIVGALTLLVLCLISCAVAFMRRRCQRGGRSLDEGGFVFGGGGGGLGVLTQAQRDALPQVDAEGRPIRYDAHGRQLPDLGARKEEIQALPTRIFQTGMIPKEDATCTICLGEYEPDEKIRDLPCSHVRKNTRQLDRLNLASCQRLLAHSYLFV